MKFYQGLGVILGTTTLALVQYQPVSALTPVQVNDIAKPITVMIGGLDGKGSGVIIDKNGNTYTVLTAIMWLKKRDMVFMRLSPMTGKNTRWKTKLKFWEN